MKTFSDLQLKQDWVKFCFLLIALAGTGAAFIVTPAFSIPTLLSIVFTMLLSPFVALFERRGYPRALSITLLYIILGMSFALVGLWITQSVGTEWDSLKKTGPEYFQAAIQRMHTFEMTWKKNYPFLKSTHPTDSLVSWIEGTSQWFVNNGPSIMGSLLSYILFVPFLTFVLLLDGRAIRKRFFELVPNRFFETAYMMSTGITTALADYLRAKLLEAFLVGVMITMGLVMIKAPYAAVLGIVAAVTNIIPYLGPLIGMTPGILIAVFDTAHPNLIWSMVTVYMIANMIDIFFIFPIVVAKLVNLHPLFLIAVVALGQQYYGLIGMLISIPIACAIKVVIQEIYMALYHHRPSTLTAAESKKEHP